MERSGSISKVWDAAEKQAGLFAVVADEGRGMY